MPTDYEVLAKTSPRHFSDEFETVGCGKSNLFHLRDAVVFGELRPVDGGSSIVLDKPSITFGQDRTCDVVIEHPSVAANHCHMEIRDGHWFIEDLGSRGGICVNGEKVVSAWVPAQSVINIGGLEFDLQYSSANLTEAGHGSVSPVLLSKLEHALKAIPPQRSQRVQVRVGSPLPPETPTTTFGRLLSKDDEFPIPLFYDELYVGRDSDCDVILPSVEVARTHCVLRLQDGFWLVRDLNNNGVSIDGQAVQEGWLLPGAVLGVASHQFEIAYTTLSDSPPETVVPINEFNLPNDDETLIDDEDEAPDTLSATPIDFAAEPPAAERSVTTHTMDEPLLALDEMLASIEELMPAVEDRFPPPTNPIPAEPIPTEPQLAEPQPAQDLAPQNSELVNPSVLLQQRPDPPILNSAAPDLSLDAQTSPLVNRQSARGKRPKANDRVTAIPEPNASRLPEPSTIDRPMINVPLQKFVQQKQERIRQFLKDREFGGLLLTRPSNIAWYAGGAEVPSSFCGQATTALLITPEGSTLLSRKSDAELLLNSAALGIGLKHQDCDWPDGARDLLKDGLGIKNIACDQSWESCVDVSPDVATMRLTLSRQELELLRILGIRVARTVEKAAREFCRGDTESQIAGDVAARLVRHGVHPQRIQVWGDGRGQHCQNWNFGRDPVKRYCTISVIGQRQGLHVAVSRTVSFGIPPKELRWNYSDMFMAHATGLLGLHNLAEPATVWSEVRQACDKLGCSTEFRASAPGFVTGYELCEAPLSPTSSLRLQADMPVVWQSSVGPARAVDTVLIREADCKVITQTDEWPQTRVVIKKTKLFGQAVLERGH